MIPPLLTEIAADVARDVNGSSAVVDDGDAFAMEFVRGDDRRSFRVLKSLFDDAFEFGERRIRAELEHEARKACEALR